MRSPRPAASNSALTIGGPLNEVGHTVATIEKIQSTHPALNKPRKHMPSQGGYRSDISISHPASKAAQKFLHTLNVAG
ncbi:MAG: hypothetical protein ACPG9T_15600, partial [Pseudomonadales bacterium]